mgnify:CR=1 FL=1
MRAFFTRDRIAGFVSVALAAVVAAMCFLQIPASKMAGDVGSRAFPLLSASVIAVCGLLLLLRKNKKEEKVFLLPFQWKRLTGILLLYLMYYLALNFLGFLVATPVFVFILCTLLAGAAKKSVSVIKRIIFAAISTAAIYSIFQLALRVTLPQGIFKGMF